MTDDNINRMIAIERRTGLPDTGDFGQQENAFVGGEKIRGLDYHGFKQNYTP